VPSVVAASTLAGTVPPEAPPALGFVDAGAPPLLDPPGPAFGVPEEPMQSAPVFGAVGPGEVP
jgi:hypothetical protein